MRSDSINDVDWLSNISTDRRESPFNYKFRQQLSAADPQLPKSAVYLVRGEDLLLEMDHDEEFIIKGPFDDEDFQERLPYLVYSLTERTRQKELGVVTVHAVAASKNHEGILILGDKGAGKTSLLLALCLERQYQVIGNDSVLLQKGRPLSLLAGTQNIDIRECVIDKFDNISGMEISSTSLGAYERKTRVFPEDLGLSTETKKVPVAKVVRVNIHEANSEKSVTSEIPTTIELLRLNENFSRYIRGVTTPLQIKGNSIHGYHPSCDSKELGNMRNTMINTLVNETPFYYITAASPQEAAELIENL